MRNDHIYEGHDFETLDSQNLGNKLIVLGLAGLLGFIFKKDKNFANTSKLKITGGAFGVCLLGQTLIGQGPTSSISECLLPAAAFGTGTLIA